MGKINIASFLFFSLLSLFIFSSACFSVAAISPAYVNVKYAANTTVKGSFDTLNKGTTQEDMTAVSGSPYIKITSPKVFSVPSGGSSPVNYELTLPADFPPGKTSLYITVTNAPQQKGSIAIAVAYNFVVFVEKPYPAEYAEAGGPTITADGKKVFIEVSAANKGSIPLKGAKASARIYDAEGKILDTLVSDSKDIPLDSTVAMKMNWEASTDGVYPIEVWIDYAQGQKSNVLKSNIFVGEPKLEVGKLQSQIKSGSLIEYKIPVNNKWNQPINASAVFKVMSGDNLVLSTQPSAIKEIGAQSSSDLMVYLDASKISPGYYNVVVELTYRGKTTLQDFYDPTSKKYSFKLEVLQPGSTSPQNNSNQTGPANPPPATDNTNLLVAFGVAVVVLVAIAFFLTKKKSGAKAEKEEDVPEGPESEEESGSFSATSRKDEDDEE